MIQQENRNRKVNKFEDDDDEFDTIIMGTFSSPQGRELPFYINTK